MRSLFVKIFLSYWMATALFFVLAILTAFTMRPSGEISNLQAQQSKFLSDALQAYQSGGKEAARQYLRSIHDARHVRFWIFDAQGKELMGHTAEPWTERARRGKMSSADTFWGRLRPVQFLRVSEAGSDGHTYTLITQLPAEGFGPFGPHGVPGLGLLIGIISSGLVCYILARYLTSPIVRVRAATQKLAAGDLSARAGGLGSRRHDEMAELMRDFDRMAERLENLVNAQNRLLTDISHELRSPLARLNVALELARQRSGSDAGSALDRIDRESGRLNELIERLLMLARLESGAESTEKASVQLEQLIDEIAKDASFEAQSRKCRVDVNIVDDCIVMGSPTLLHSAIENVVRNAVRYTREGSTVEVCLERQDQSPGPARAVIRIADSGPGVPEDALDKIFQPFYRIDDARGRQTGGTGLGLSITERSIRLHGGTVRATNRPGGGLVVEIHLPLASKVKSDSAAERAMPALSGTGKV